MFKSPFASFLSIVFGGIAIGALINSPTTNSAIVWALLSIAAALHGKLGE